jgi:hypothetical protein
MLTTAQLATLAADISASAEFASLPHSSDGAFEIAVAYNLPTSFVVWRTSMTTQMARSAIIAGATQLDALTVGKRDSLLWLCSDTLDPSQASVRAAIDDLCGTQNTLKGALVAAQKRNATRIEKLLATGTGTTASPATMGFEGSVSYGDIKEAMGW